MRRLGTLVGLATCTSVLLAFTHPRVSGAPMHWSGDELARTAAWAVAVGASAWLALTTGACLLATRTGRVGLARRAPALARRLAGITLAGSAVVAAAAPAGAAPGPRGIVVVDQPVVRDLVPSPVRTPSPVPPARSRARPRTHVVQSGDNLWRIARQELTARGIAHADDGTVARYWRRVIAANAGTLRSGSPSLIYPGEIVALPDPG